MTRSVERTKLTRRAIAWVGIGTTLAVLIAARQGCKNTAPPARCPEELLAIASRCCAHGQSVKLGMCVGKPLSCPAGFEQNNQGCVVTPARVRIAPGSVRIGPGDWEAQGITPRDVIVETTFEIDTYEVTVDRWEGCVEQGSCQRLAMQEERGCAVRSISFAQAERFCRWAGGDVPTEEAWILAAAGTSANRYPWGNTGAVCRRADWGRAQGPCTRGATGPEWAGLIVNDITPQGVVGMAGGVAEWVSAHDGPAVRGGSFRSQLATELRTWRRDKRDAAGSHDDVGVRCMYQ